MSTSQPLQFSPMPAPGAVSPEITFVRSGVSEIFQLADPASHHRNDREIVRTAQPKLHMIEQVKSPGGTKWFDVSKLPLLDQTGKVYSLLGFSVDITEQRLAEEARSQSRRQLQAIIDDSPSIIYVKDLDGRFQLINRSFQCLFNTSREDIPGKPDHHIFPRTLADEFRRNDREAIETNSSIEREEVVMHGDVARTYISVKFPLTDLSGAPYALCGISTDITDRKLTEGKIRLSESQLVEAQRLALMGSWVWDAHEQPDKLV